MSFHVNNSETEAQLRAQRRNSSIASVIVGLLLMTLVGLVFYLLKDYIYTEKVEPITTFTSDDQEEVVLEKTKVTQNVQKKPSAPSSSAVKVITAQATSSVSISAPEIEVDSLSVEFGESDGFGEGFGEGFGFGGGSASDGNFNFMGSSGSANDVAFVIDWSLSMKGKNRLPLLQAEMKKTFEDIPNGSRIQVIMFCGPYWIVTDENSPSKINRRDVFSTKDDETGEKYTFKGLGGDSDKVKKRKAQWTIMSEQYRKKLLKFVDRGELGLGTEWGRPLNFALEMKPAPKTVIFLTDGVAGNTDKVVKDIGTLANKKGTVVKTISLLEPKAEKAMRALAKNTGGSFTLVTGTKESERKTTEYGKK